MKKQMQHQHGSAYIRFLAMVGVSTIVMFGLMYLNTYTADHLFFSETRAYMALLMGGCMALVMLAFMTHMLNDRAKNLGIVAASLLVVFASLWLVRSQATVDDLSFMRAMIPHHSIAILTSSRAQIKDARVRKLADGIVDTQVREIDEMKRLVAEIAARR
jgi:hypothetical protein